MKISPVLAVAGLSLFFLTACLPEGDDKKGPDETTTQTVDTAPLTQTPQGTGALDPEKILTMTFEVTTGDGRPLDVTTIAYCATLDKDMKLAAYKTQCRENVGNKLNIVARVYRCFESSIPAVDVSTRAHPALPESDGFCYGRNDYKETYASFPVDMMLRAAEQMSYYDLYTVTEIKPK